MLKTALGRFRAIALAEGVSYVVLLCIAMPLKYFADLPLAVKYTGWAHGLLFVLYMFALLMVVIENGWGFKKTIVAFIASLIPFAAFWLDGKLKKEQLESSASM